MKFLDLQPEFLALTDKPGTYHRVDDIAQAQGVRFSCPKCRNHIVICWDGTVPASITPGPGRWAMHGTGLHDLSLTGWGGRSNSVALQGGCAWHGFVTNGEVTSV